MSRIGRMPVAIPAGVTVTIAENNLVTVKGPKGTLERELPVEMSIKEEDGHIIVTRPKDVYKRQLLKTGTPDGMLKLILLTIWLRITRSEHTLRRNYTAPAFPRLKSSAHLIE